MAHRKHEKEIRAWLDGAKIQGRFAGSPWQDVEDDRPDWNPIVEYRVKPAEPEREYPKTTASREYFVQARRHLESWHHEEAIANAALRHACDAGQIVTRAEFDRAIGDRAARDMEIAKIVSEDPCRFGRAFHSEDQLRHLINDIK